MDKKQSKHGILKGKTKGKPPKSRIGRRKDFKDRLLGGTKWKKKTSKIAGK